jgi:hypothetical protein
VLHLLHSSLLIKVHKRQLQRDVHHLRRSHKHSQRFQTMTKTRYAVHMQNVEE